MVYVCHVYVVIVFIFFKPNTAYEMRISDCSSDVCSSDLANYVLRSLEDVLDAPFAASGPCMHEALFSDKGLAEGFSTLDIAKGLIDEGYHPMTVYFPLVVHGAMLVEPTETESKAVLDQFIGAMRDRKSTRLNSRH